MTLMSGLGQPTSQEYLLSGRFFPKPPVKSEGGP